MDIREKLVELICRAHHNASCVIGYEGSDEEALEEEVRYLISNGVTVQEWISVNDRLPEPFVSVLVQMPGEEPFPTVREGFISNDGIWQSAMFRREPGEVTHWMQMPQPPKGE